MRKHTYFNVKPASAASKKRGYGAIARTQNTPLTTGVFYLFG